MKSIYVKFAGTSQNGYPYANVICAPSTTLPEDIQDGFKQWKRLIGEAGIRLHAASWYRITRPPLRELRQQMTALAAKYSTLDLQRRDLSLLITPTLLDAYRTNPRPRI